MQGIALEAVRNAGHLGGSLPVPPHGVLNTFDACISLLAGAGLKPETLHSGLIKRTLRLANVAELTHLIERGTVRLASLLRSQPDANRFCFSFIAPTARIQRAADARVAG